MHNLTFLRLLHSPLSSEFSFFIQTLGNHEFDNGIKGLIPFIQQARFKIVSSNMDVSAEPLWPNPPLFTKSTILQRNNIKIGVIGYITPDTAW